MSDTGAHRRKQSIRAGKPQSAPRRKAERNKLRGGNVLEHDNTVVGRAHKEHIELPARGTEKRQVDAKCYDAQNQEQHCRPPEISE